MRGDHRARRRRRARHRRGRRTRPARLLHPGAHRSRRQLTVLVEKEQVALLAAEAVAFLDRIADDYPELPFDVPSTQSVLREPTVPLFRARLIGLGFDPERELVLLELRERADDEDEDAEAEVERRRRRRRGLRRPHLRDPRPGARHGRSGRRGGRRRAPAVPAVRAADGPVRAHVSSLELTPDGAAGRARGAPSSRSSAACAYSSNATFLVEAKVDGMELAAIYKPRRGERPLWDFPQGTLCQREVAAYELSAALGLGHRAAHDPARRPARRRRGAAVRRPRSRRALLHAARRARGPLPRSSPRSTCSSTTPIARAGTASTTR